MAHVGEGDSGGDRPAPGAPASWRRRTLDWLRGRQDQLEAARQTSTTVGVAYDAFSYDTSTGAPVLAAALGFRIFLFQVPLAGLFVIIGGFVSSITGNDAASYFHGRGIGALTAMAVSGAADLSGWARVSALVLVAYALFLAARSLVKVIYIVHALVWNVPRTKVRGANRGALALIGIVSVLVGLSLLISIVGDTSAGGLTLLLLYTGALMASWWVIAARLPHRDCPPIALAPGAVLFAIGTELLHVATVIWFPHYIQSKSAVYGAVGVALVLLLWAYLVGRVVTLAVVLNAALWARFGTESERPLRLGRPRVHLPLIDGAFTRVWAAVFGDVAGHAGPGDGEPNDGGRRGQDGGERAPTQRGPARDQREQAG